MLSIWHLAFLAGGILLVWVMTRIMLSYVFYGAISRPCPSIDRRYERQLLLTPICASGIGLVAALVLGVDVAWAMGLLLGPLLCAYLAGGVIREYYRREDGRSRESEG